uniref:Kazal-like domain-containing protein n=1 Tax=Strigamia maritima TaxID=126957 RepID=T1IPB1_STRMM
MLKKSCRKKKPLQVAYYGACQKSCTALRCPGKKQCLLDQNLTPHCVRCSRACPDSKAKKYVCGVDGVSYTSFCHLRQAACQKGRAIPVAYPGKCKIGATCDTVRCPRGKTCLTEPGTGRPRCTTCHFNCRAVKFHLQGPVCATNNVTYASWCHMMQASCSLRTALELRSNAKCEESNSTHEPNSIPLVDQETSSTKS